MVLLDLIMPYMDGKEFLDEMEKDGKIGEMSIVILSSSSSFCDKQECESKGVLKYFVKPLTPDISKEILHMASVA